MLQTVLAKRFFLSVFSCIIFFSSYGQMLVNTTTPFKNQTGIQADANITIQFTETVDQGTVDNNTPGNASDDNIQIFGSLSGQISGAFSGGGTTTIVFDPTVDFRSGEKIMVYINYAVLSLIANPTVPDYLEFYVQGGLATGGLPNYNAITGTTTFFSSDIELGDIDNDTNLDVVTATSAGIYVAYGDGLGGFSSPTQETTNPTAFVELADFNLDGLLDMVVATESGNPYTIDIYLNDGSADPTIFPGTPTSTVSNAAGGINLFSGLGVGDFTRDGVPDVIVGQQVLTNGVKVYEVEGTSGTFFGEAATASGNVSAGDFIIGDFDNSGTQDYILTIPSGSNSVNFNNSVGVGDPSFSPVGSGISIEYGKAADFNGDGFIDLAYLQSNFLQVRPGDGSGDYTTAGYSAGNDSEKLAIGDLNGDGLLDITTVGNSGTRRTYLNQGSLNFTVQNLSALTFMSAVSLGDADNDGIVDAVYAVNNGSSANRISLGEPLPPLVTVQNANDAGAGSLRQAIADVAPGGTILFDPILDGVPIQLVSILMVQKDITFDGEGRDIILSGDTDASGTNNVGDTQIMSIGEGQNVSFTSMTFEYGYVSADIGGALQINAGSNVSLSQCIFRNNAAVNANGAAAAIGVALSNIDIDRCVFQDNAAFEGGGAIYLIANDNSTNTANIYNTAFINNTVTNTGSFGGAIIISSGGSNTPNNTIATIYNCTFDSNSADGNGGAVFLGNATSIPGNSNTFTLSNNTFYNNNSVTSNLGDAIYVGSESDLSLYNTIIASTENTAVSVNGLGTISASSNNIIAQQPSTFGAINVGTLLPTEIINTTLIPGPNGSYLELSPASPAFDAGTNTQVLQDILDIDDDLNTSENTPLDAAGNPREWDPATAATGTVDIGAVESQIPPSVTITFPNGGESFNEGEMVTITWDEVNVSSSEILEIEYSLNGGAGYNFLTDSPSGTFAGQYNWTVPADISSNVLVRVSNTSDAILDVSDAPFDLLGPAQNSLSFDGVDDFVDIPDAASLDITGALTVETWVKFNEAIPAEDVPLVTKWNDVGNQRSYVLQLSSSSEILFGVSATGSSDVLGTDISAIFVPFTFNVGQWYHIAGVFTPSTSLEIYVNGEKVGEELTNMVGSIHSGTSLVSLRNFGNGSTPSGGALELDETRIWSTNLDQSTIQTQLFSELVGSEGNLEAYYNFNTVSGSIITDITTNSNDGNLFNDSGNTPPADGVTDGPLWQVSSVFDSDVVAPFFETGYPAIDAITSSGFDMTVQLNEPGAYYYVVVPDAAIAPTVIEVLNGTGSGGSGQVDAGNISVTTPTTDFVLSATGLSSGTDYDVYIAAQDDEGSPNVQFNTTFFDVTTTAQPLILSTSTPTPNEIGVVANTNITLDFDADIDLTSVHNGTTGSVDVDDDNIVIYGDQTGLVEGVWSESLGNAIFNPTNDFKPGEGITLTLTDGVQGTSGEVAVGETFRFTAATQPGPGSFPLAENSISTTADGAYSVYAADVDGDGDLDVFSASRADNKIAWYENDGSETFTEQVISTTANSVRSVYAADVDRDGDLDVLSASALDNKIAWYENDGSETFTERVISTTADGAYSVYAADVDGDGDLDVLSASRVDGKVAWYENDGSETFTERVISTTADGAQSVYAADVDGDGDLDVLSASELDNKIAWYENDGSANFTEQVISTTADGAWSVYAADVDGDGDLDVLSASSSDNKIAWYENDGSETFTEHVISTSAVFAISVYAADVDGDGDLDVLSASLTDDKIAWYENSIAPPLPPSNLIAYPSLATDITLEWTDNATDETGYLIERADDFAFTTNIQIVDNTLSADATSYVFAAGADQPYFYRVTPTNGGEDASSQSSVEFATTEVFPGQALSFDGTDDIVTVTNASTLSFTNTSVFAGEAWINPDVTDTYQHIFGKRDGTFRGYSFNLRSDGTIELVLQHTSGNRIIVYGSTVLSNGVWTHVAFSYNGNSDESGISLYVNGIEETKTVAQNVLASNDFSNSAPFEIGDVASTANPFDGLMDEVKVWSVVKSDFSDRFNPLQGNEANLVAYYPFDENSGTTTVDRSVNTNDGAITGSIFTLSDIFEDGVVTNTNDSGPGSLREAIIFANANPATTITFDIQGGGPYNIPLATALPEITAAGTIIDGTTQPGWTFGDVNNMVEVDGGALASQIPGLVINNVANVEIYGLIVSGFTSISESIAAIEVEGDGADNVIIGAPTKGNILHDMISAGISITDADFTTIQSNRLGTLDGTNRSEIGKHGIYVSGTVDNLTIGGDSGSGEGNVISGAGNGRRGILSIALGSNLVIQGNYIGTNAAGTGSLHNEGGAVDIGGAMTFLLGGTTPGQENIISGNNTDNAAVGVRIGSAPEGSIVNNIIGLAVDGITDLGNGGAGILLNTTSTGVMIDGNIISSNGEAAITSATGFSNIDIINNIIGFDKNLVNPRPNAAGIVIDNGSGTNNRFGYKDNPNVIANNTGPAISLTASSVGNTFATNQIYNNGSGIVLATGAHNDILAPVISSVSVTTVSGTGTDGDMVHLYLADAGGQGETFLDSALVSGGIWDIGGLSLTGTDEVVATSTNSTDGTSVFSVPSSIDLSVVTHTGDTGVGSLREAITYANANPSTTISFNIGGTGPWIIAPVTPLPSITADGTIIDGTTESNWDRVSGQMILIQDDNAIDGIGLDIGAANVEVYGLQVRGWTIGIQGGFSGNADFLVVGADTKSNVLSGNDIGIYCQYCFTVDFSYNFVGTDVTGATADANRVGIDFGNYDENYSEVSNLTMQNNLISGNTDLGVAVGYSNNEVFGNKIGTNNTISAALPNGVGLLLTGFEDDVHDNVISGNTIAGIRMDGFHLGEPRIYKNFIGTDPTETVILGNGIGIEGTFYDATTPISTGLIGSFTASDANVIAYSAGAAVSLDGDVFLKNRIINNRMFENGDGIVLTNGAAGTQVPPTITSVTIAEISGTIADDLPSKIHVYEVDPATNNQGLIPIDSVNTVGAFTWAVSSGGYDDTKNYVATVTTDEFGTSAFSTNASISDNALDFDGVDDHISVVHDNLLNPADASPFSVEFWIKPESISGLQTILFKGNQLGIDIGRDNWGLHIRGDANGEVDFILGKEAAGDHFRTDLELIPGVWQHIALTTSDFGGDESAYTFYLNGNPITKTVIADLDPAALTNTDPMTIGNENGAHHFNGVLDEIRIWNTERSELDIELNLFNELNGNETGLIAYYNFDQGIPEGDNSSETTLTDGTLNGLNGTLTNFALTSGLESNWVSSDALIDRPMPPVNLFITEISDTEVQLTYEDRSHNAQGVRFERSDGNNSSYVEVYNDELVTSWNDGSLDPEMNYFYRVIFDGVGADSYPSNEKAAATFTAPGNALTFDGVDDYITGSSFGITPTELSIECWAKMNPSQTTPAMLIQGGPFAIYVNRFNTTGQILGFFDGNSSNNSVLDESSASIQDGSWHHVAATNDGNTTRVYVDGILSATHSEVLGVGATDFYFGSNAGTAHYFDGELEEIRIWEILRSEAEIQANMNISLVGNESGLVSYYKFDQTDPAITVLPDRSTNQNDGVLNGFGGVASWNASGAFASESDMAISLDGTDDFVEFGDPAILDFGSDDFTVEFWVQKNEITTSFDNLYGLSKWNSGANPGSNEWHLAIGANTNDDFPLFGIESGTTSSRVVSPVALTIGEWTHIAGVKSGDEIRLYQNGELVDTETGVGDVNNAGLTMRLGVNNPGGAAPLYYSNADFDNIRVWNIARSQDDIIADAQSVLTSVTNLIGSYVADQTSGDLIDLTGITGDGILNGGPSYIVSTVPTTDVFPPVFLNGFPLVDDITVDDFQINSDANEQGYLFVGVYADGSTPSSDDVVNGTGAITFASVLNATVTTRIGGGLAEGTDYDVYFVLDDLEGNRQLLPTLVEVTTATIDNYALEFDGTDDHVQVSSPDGFPVGSAPRTLELWFKSDVDLTVNTDHGIAQYGTTLNGQMFGLITSSNDPGKLYFFGNNQDLAGTTTLTPDTWYHAAVAFDGMNVSLYLNGNLEASTALSLNTVMSGDGFTIGRRPGLENFWDGQMDEVRLWDYARTEEEIQATFDHSLNGNEPGLVAYYDFEDGTGSTILIDALGNYEGTLINMDENTDWVASVVLAGPLSLAPTNLTTTVISTSQIDLAWTDNSSDETEFAIYRSDGDSSSYVQIGTADADFTTYSDNSVTADNNYYYYVVARNANGDSPPSNTGMAATFAPLENALNFDGIDDYIVTPIQIDYASNQNMTWEFWLKPINGVTSNTILSNDDGAFDWTFYIDGGIFHFLNGTQFYSTGVPADLNQWQHVAVVFQDNDSLKLYKNGVLSFAGISTFSDNATATPLNIGRNPGTNGSFYNGDLDELRIWNVARNATEIGSEYQSKIPIDTTGLIAWYHFDQGIPGSANPSETSLIDSSVNQLDGDLTNFALSGVFSNWVSSEAFIAVDNTAPVVTINSLVTTQTSPELTGTIDDTTATLEVAVDGFSYPALNNGDSSWTLTAGTISDLIPGTYDVTIDAQDSIGNTFNNTFTGVLTIEPLIDPEIALDSSALLLIYDQLGGANWTRGNNWRQGLPMSSWDDIVLSNGRVVEIDLSNNNLIGNFPAITEGLDLLTDLDLSSNQLSAIGDISSLVSLTALDVSSNNLDFGDLEIIVSNFPFSIYSPQPIALQQVRVTREIGSNYVVNRSVPGTSNQYSWTLDGVALADTGPTIDVSITDFSVDGAYVAEVTNSLVPGLTITTRPVVVRVSSLERDSTALRVIYDALVTASSSVTDWTMLPMSGWTEIQITGNRVVSIDLSDKGLSGSMPLDIIDLQELTSADFSNNEIEDLPIIADSLSQVTLFDVRNNDLEFDDLESNMTVPGIEYDQQNPVGSLLETEIEVGTNYQISIPVGGTSNNYSWYLTTTSGSLEDQLIAGATNDSYQINSINYSNMGTYVMEVENDLVPGLVLTSESQIIQAYANLEFVGIGLENELISEGEAYALGITNPGAPYDSVKTINAESGIFLFDKLQLGNYIIAFESNPEVYVPTYFVSTDLWSAAEVLLLRSNLKDTLFMIQQPIETQGVVTFQGLLEAEFLSESDGRVLARRKVKKAGCSLRRRTRSGGGRGEQEYTYELYAYVQSDENGNFVFNDIDTGYYRLNIEYPGIPMDESSFVEFQIGGDGLLGEKIVVSATVSEEGINVILEEGLGFKSYFKELKVFPNPVDNELNISYSELSREGIIMQLIDLSGNVVIQEQTKPGFGKSYTLKMVDLPSGLYILRFEDVLNNSQIGYYKVYIKH